MQLTRRDLFATSSIALASISHAFGQTPPAPADVVRPASRQRRHLHRARRHHRHARGAGWHRRRRHAVRRYGGNRPRQPQADDRANDRRPHQHAPSRRSHVRQYRLPIRRPRNTSRTEMCRHSRSAGRRRKNGGAAGVCRHDLRHHVVGKSRDRNRQPEVLRTRPYERRQRLRRFRTRTWCTWAT